MYCIKKVVLHCLPALLWTLHLCNCPKFKSEHENHRSEMFSLKGNCSKYFLIQAINHMTGTLQCLNSAIYRLCCHTHPQEAVKTTTRALHHITNLFPKSSVKSEQTFRLMWHKDITDECLSCHTRQLWFCKSPWLHQWNTYTSIWHFLCSASRRNSMSTAIRISAFPLVFLHAAVSYWSLPSQLSRRER